MEYTYEIEWSTTYTATVKDSKGNEIAVIEINDLIEKWIDDNLADKIHSDIEE